MKRTLLSLLLLSVAACSRMPDAPIPAAHPDDSAPRRGGTLTVATFAGIRGLDPATAADGLTAEIDQMLFSGLIDYDEHATIVPDVAESYSVSEDGLRYTFVLRHGVTFHDGTELLSGDVKRSIDRALSPESSNPFASFFDHIEGFEAFQKKETTSLSGVTTDGPYSVTIRLSARDSMFLPLLALPSLRPVCKSGGDHAIPTWHPCGAGPFKLPLDGWDKGRSVTVVRHDQYFRPGLPYLDRVVSLYGVHQATQQFKFVSGELDIFRDLNNAEGLQFQSDPRWSKQMQFEADHSVWGESMNVEMAPFNNVEVRRAVASAINRDRYQKFRPMNVRGAFQLIPAAVPGYEASAPSQTYDVADALEHMKKAGFPYDPATGKGGYEPRITYVAYRQGYSEYSAQLLQQDLAKIGLRLDIKLVSYATYLALTQTRGKVAMSPQGWTADFPEAWDFYESLFTSRSIAETQSQNASFYSNPRFDDLIAKARNELDSAKRYALYREADQILKDDAPWAFTTSYRFANISQPYVRNFKPHPVWNRELREVWLDRGTAR